jgi:hypothetical protein
MGYYERVATLGLAEQFYTRASLFHDQGHRQVRIFFNSGPGIFRRFRAVSGAHSEVLVGDNQLLKKGDSIARLDPWDYEIAGSSLRQPVKKIHLVSCRSRMAKLIAGKTSAALRKTRQCPQGPNVRLTSMSNDFTRRELLKSWGLIVGAGVVAPQLVLAEVSKPTPSSKTDSLVRLSLNENPYGSSPNVA